MNKFLGCVLLLATFLAGMMTETFRDTEPAKKAAYNRGYTEGNNKGFTEGRELGEGEAKKAIEGVLYTAMYCEPAPLQEQVCLVKQGTLMGGSAQFIDVPVDEPAIKPGQKFRVSYSSGDHIYFTE